MTKVLQQEDFASLTEKAYQAISGAIASLELKPGETLTQDRLAKWLSISRTPVREALRRLEQEGVIQTVAGRGLIVTELTMKDVEDMLEMLRLLDTQAAYLAAERRTSEQARRMLEISQELLVAAQQRDVQEWTRVDRPYHKTLLDAAGNHFLRHTVLEIRRRLQRVTYNVALEGDFMLTGTYEHIAVAQAISDQDADKAASAMREHLDNVATKALGLLRMYVVPLRGERF